MGLQRYLIYLPAIRITYFQWWAYRISSSENVLALYVKNVLVDTHSTMSDPGDGYESSLFRCCSSRSLQPINSWGSMAFLYIQAPWWNQMKQTIWQGQALVRLFAYWVSFIVPPQSSDSDLEFLFSPQFPPQWWEKATDNVLSPTRIGVLSPLSTTTPLWKISVLCSLRSESSVPIQEAKKLFEGEVYSQILFLNRSSWNMIRLTSTWWVTFWCVF